MRATRRHGLIGLALVALGGALLMGLWPRGGGGDAVEPTRQAGAGSAGGGRRFVFAASPEAGPSGPAEDQLPEARCWKNLLAFDQGASLEEFRDSVAEALASGDALVAEYLQERLGELIGGDAEKALQVLAWGAAAPMPEAELYFEALKRSPAIHDPRVADRLLELGETKSATLDHRAAALNALETQKQLSPERLRRMKAIALDETADGAAWTAARTIGRVMKEDLERTGTFKPYWDELLDIGQRSQEPAVRLLALEMPSYSDPLLQKDSIPALLDILRNEREQGVREMAAFRLGLTEAPEEALTALEQAFQVEHDLCVRWALFRFAVRAAGTRSFPALERMVRVDARFGRDLEDFRRLYAQGTVDFARIWAEKQEHHPCVGEEGAPHGG